ncbi:hypothetical protein F4553_001792 [Allocatelliglobosispora scoriae]|uniref:Uncharacterized protein n=1 Tax=Allocatelliglobosispora scoriae TaxID=643052 RepID=A0A841BN80_9ACTN|nr:hypothetical protein [Allocatelliglobosispora scoriae]MBB5868413.1 hypothetical protein [Allocatelliglobosispora scoriae]
MIYWVMTFRTGITQGGGVSALQTKFPHATMCRLFISGERDPQSLTKPTQALTEAYWAKGIVPVVSFKPKAAAVAAGQWDQYLKNSPSSWPGSTRPGSSPGTNRKATWTARCTPRCSTVSTT